MWTSAVLLSVATFDCGGRLHSHIKRHSAKTRASDRRYVTSVQLVTRLGAGSSCRAPEPLIFSRRAAGVISGGSLNFNHENTNGGRNHLPYYGPISLSKVCAWCRGHSSFILAHGHLSHLEPRVQWTVTRRWNPKSMASAESSHCPTGLPSSWS
jgi:hypothetical protein